MSIKLLSDRFIRDDYLQFLLLLIFTAPVFFLLTGEIFSDNNFTYDSQGKLKRLPLPFSIIVCFIGIALLFDVKKLKSEVTFIFTFFVAMMLSIAFTSGNTGADDIYKFVLMVQFLLPTFALLLGALYKVPKSEHLRIESILLYLLLVIVPAELFLTLLEGQFILTPHLYYFSLYQHMQYLPVVFVAFYLLVVLANFENIFLQIFTIILAPFMGAYICASLSILAWLFAGLGGCFGVWLLYKSKRLRFALVILFLVIAGAVSYLPYATSSKVFQLKFDTQTKVAVEESGNDSNSSNHNRYESFVPNNLKERFNYWEYYFDSATSNPTKFIFGHQTKPDREKYPSAHNYYLDLIYQFGLVAVIPLLFLMFRTIKLIFSSLTHENVSSSGLMLIFLVAYFLMVDSNLKVGLRQPYPGMMMFFLWGILISMLESSKSHKKV